MTVKWLLWLPFLACIGLFGIFFLQLRHPDDHVIASQMVGQPLPDFNAAPAISDLPGTATADFRDGKPRLLNIFASWCVPCIREIPNLLRLQAQGVEINGIAVHDTSRELTTFLTQNGNPYARIGLDEGGRAQMAFGSAGVPETFVVNGRGQIIYQHVGVVTDEDMSKLLDMLKGTEQ